MSETEFTLPGITFRKLATPSSGTTELAVWWIQAQPDAVGEPHTLDREEIFTVVSGSITATVGDQRHRVHAGQAVTVPAGALFALHAEGPEPAELVACATAGIQATLHGRRISPPWTL